MTIFYLTFDCRGSYSVPVGSKAEFLMALLLVNSLGAFRCFPSMTSYCHMYGIVADHLILFSSAPDVLFQHSLPVYHLPFPAGEIRVDPLSPPPDAKIGELITFEGVLSAPAPPGSAAARAWNTVAEGMRTADDGTSGWEGVPMQTSGGACTSSITGRVR